MAREKEYKLSIDPRILELLGPSLYTNIYYVLAELIANAYDADAQNVYIIEHPDEIVVEDDGHGMSYNNGDIKKYLDVAKESRTSDKDSQTPLFKRKKMGRKGVGKLAALSVSENVYIRTIRDGEKSGFILSRHVDDSHKLTPLPENEITFERIKDNGTSVSMKNPQYSLNKTMDSIKRNFIKIFPLLDSNFQIHIVRGSKDNLIERNDEEIVKEFSSLITLGEEYKCLGNFLDPKIDKAKLLKSKSAKCIPIKMLNRLQREVDCIVSIEGWVGAYKSTRGRKTGGVIDFPDNYISLYANKKMGEFNILPLVGENRLQEVFVVGQLHVDVFEDSNLPDMALSNRQGYKYDDPRYQAVLNYVKKDLLLDILSLRTAFAKMQKKDKDARKNIQMINKEKEFRQKVDLFRKETAEEASQKIVRLGKQISTSQVEKIISESLNKNSPSLGLKPLIDSQKKKILISHTKKDKALADVIFNILQFNGVPAEEIIYTSSDDDSSRIPDGHDIFDYLRNFFVESYSDTKIWVIFVTSENIQKSWGTMSEVGAAWITKKDHRIFNTKGFIPEKPLNVNSTWVEIKRDDDDSLSVDKVNADEFCVKIRNICSSLDFIPKSKQDNMSYLKKQIDIED